MTKIVAFSDLHGQYSKKLTGWFNNHPADILLFAGDLQKNNFDDGKEFLQWLDKLPYEHKVLTFGNHDCNYRYVLDQAKLYNNIHFLFNQSIILEGIKFFGSPNSRIFGSWSFMNTEKELKDIYDTVPDDTNILITHTPAFEILDLTCSGESAGSYSLRKRIKELKYLKYHIVGHIHEGYGAISEGDLKIFNTSLLDENYRFVHMPIIFYY
jgi:Icc-related predicted phosphoesterase